jgi:hypothetical protein
MLNNLNTSTTGNIYTNSVVSNTTLTINTTAVLTSTSITSGLAVVIDTWNSDTYGAAKYFIKMEDTGLVCSHVVEMVIMESYGVAYQTQYNEIIGGFNGGSSLGTFDATVAANTVTLTWTPTQTSGLTTLKMTKTVI